MRKCKDCGKMKDESCFSSSANASGYCSYCKPCNSKRMYEYRKKYVQMYPWLIHLYNSRYRVHKNNPDHKYYHDKGIKNFLTREDIKYLWKRDKAGLFKEPSLDRIDSNGHYSLQNCQFISFNENRRKR